MTTTIVTIHGADFEDAEIHDPSEHPRSNYVEAEVPLTDVPNWTDRFEGIVHKVAETHLCNDEAIEIFTETANPQKARRPLCDDENGVVKDGCEDDWRNVYEARDHLDEIRVTIKVPWSNIKYITEN